MLPPRGGTNILDCLSTSKIYEVVDNAVKLALRQNFNEGATRGPEPVIIQTGVFIYSYFIANNWKGTSLRFKGKNAQQFYNDLRLQKLDWCIFDLTYTNLGCIDL